MLDVNNLSISFKTRNGESEAVRDVSFTLNKGETLGIVGESGSGKSVTSYSLLGLVPCPPGQITSGTAIFDDGVELFSLSEKQRRKIRGSDISMIFQDPMTSLNPYMRIGDQIIETLRAHTKISKKEAREKAISALEDVGIRDAVQRIDSYPHEFSGGMRQRVMIAMALASESKMLIADEPTTALDVTIQAQILALLADIKRRRELSMIFISHDLAVVKDIADHVLVMKDGEVVERGRPADIFDNPQHEYTQQLISAIPSDKKPTPFTGKDNDISLKVENLHTRFTQKSGYFWAPKVKEINAVDDISLELKKGEILGLVGESGSGKSTFGRSIVRLAEPLSGKVLLNGTDNLLTLSDAAFNKKRRHIQMVFQDPYASLNPRMTVFDTLAEPLKLNALADKSSLLSQVNTLMDDVGLPRNAIRKYPHEFSGGQRQRIAIARALASQPDIIVADEPVSALDVTIQAQILDLLLHINTSRGLSMLFISHDLAVVRYLCDRVAVMQKGKIVELDHCETVFNTPQHDYTKSLLSAVVGM